MYRTACVDEKRLVKKEMSRCTLGTEKDAENNEYERRTEDIVQLTVGVLKSRRLDRAERRIRCRDVETKRDETAAGRLLDRRRS